MDYETLSDMYDPDDPKLYALLDDPFNPALRSLSNEEYLDAVFNKENDDEL